MITMRAFGFLLIFLFGNVLADVYMHAPRGSNDRNCEKNVNRNNGNRLFDSQNNAKGGYACPRPRVGPTIPVDKTYYYAGSKLVVEWTNQHGCGTNPMTSCEVVIQYACEDTLDPTKKYSHTENGKRYIGTPRDGTPRDDGDAATDRIPENEESGKANTVETRRFGMHESPEWYSQCKTRSRNKGIFTADQDVRRDATGTRQNPNGNRRGLECPEERDYFPYWVPNPWRDISVITSNPQRCPYYKTESQNVKPRKVCMPITDVWGKDAVRKYPCPISKSAKSKCGQGSIEGLAKWHINHPATTAMNKDVKESQYGGFIKQLVSPGPGVAVTDAMGANPPAGSIKWQTWDHGTVKSCKTRTGDNNGCLEGTSLVGTACSAVGWPTSWENPTAESKNTNFMRVSGFFRAKMAGEHTFHMANVPGNKLWVDGKKVAAAAAEKGSTACPSSEEGWKLVRHTDGKEGKGHPATDYLAGTEIYGEPSDNALAAGSFTIDFEKTVPEYNEMLFTTGTCAHWMVMTKNEAIGSWYHNAERTVLRSSTSPLYPYKARMYRRNNVREDPWLTFGKNHNQNEALYVGKSYRAQGGRSIFSKEQGLNVFIRKHSKVAWVDAKVTLAANQQVPIVGTGAPGMWSEASIGVSLPNGYTSAPIETQGKGSSLYEMCGTAGCTGSTASAAPQTQATSKCKCKAWPADYGAGGSACQQPDKDPKEAPWCLCEGDKTTVAGAVKGKGYDGTLLAMGKIDDVGKAMLYPVDTRPGAMPCGAAACVSYFFGIRGSHINDLKNAAKYKANTPDKVEVVKNNFYVTARTDNYGGMLEAYIEAPGTGTYSFGINSDDWGEVWVATAPNIRTGLKKMVNLNGCCRRVWGQTTVTWQKGQKYYLKAIYKEGGGGDYLQVGMKHAGKEYFPIPVSMAKAPALSGEPPKPTATKEGLCDAMCANTAGCTGWTTLGEDCKMYTGDIKINNNPLTFPIQIAEKAVKKGQLITDKFETSTEFQLTFDIKPTGKSNWPNLIHITDGGNGGQYGRMPGIWFIGTSYRLHVRVGRQRSHNAGCDTGAALAENKYTTVKVVLAGKRMTVYFDGKEACKTGEEYTDKNPGKKDMKVYMGDPWHNEAKASIKNFQYVKSSADPSTITSGKVSTASPTWSYCNAPPAGGRRLLAASEETWEETEIPDTQLAQNSATGKVSALAPIDDNPVNIDCVDGTTAFSRENQLGNSRGTSSNSVEDKAAIPHGLNANRYIWTVPNHVEGNCVLRLRYNISTSDYWAWNSAGTPKTNSDSNQPNNRRRRRGNNSPVSGSSPIVQDPYIGVGPDPKLHFVSMASNTNQYGRTFQDRSYVFEIKPRPAGVAADKKIYNLGMRGKRGNIVQSYPSVEYDFMPNDLCINKGDYVHFQWVGSDYNPQRNPNNGEGAGDESTEGGRRRRGSRADRTNLIDQDLHEKIQYQYSSQDKLAKSGAQNHGTSAAGMQLPMGAANPYSDLDSKYTGMFWKDGKPDKDLIQKMALLDQHKSLAKKQQTCMTIDELEKIGNNNDEERHPRNCGKMNAAMDANGQRTPYFDGGLVMMNKGGVFPYMSTRNNNFSNRNQMGSMCVADGAVGKCPAGQTCQDQIEKELIKKFTEEKADGTKKLMLIQRAEKEKAELQQQRAALEEDEKQLEEKLQLLQQN
jgi:hypothetical protein